MIPKSKLYNSPDAKVFDTSGIYTIMCYVKPEKVRVCFVVTAAGESYYDVTGEINVCDVCIVGNTVYVLAISDGNVRFNDQEYPSMGKQEMVMSFSLNERGEIKPVDLMLFATCSGEVLDDLRMARDMENYGEVYVYTKDPRTGSIMIGGELVGESLERNVILKIRAGGLENERVVYRFPDLTLIESPEKHKPYCYSYERSLPGVEHTCTGEYRKGIVTPADMYMDAKNVKFTCDETGTWRAWCVAFEDHVMIFLQDDYKGSIQLLGNVKIVDLVVNNGGGLLIALNITGKVLMKLASGGVRTFSGKDQQNLLLLQFVMGSNFRLLLNGSVVIETDEPGPDSKVVGIAMRSVDHIESLLQLESTGRFEIYGEPRPAGKCFMSLYNTGISESPIGIVGQISGDTAMVQLRSPVVRTGRYLVPGLEYYIDDTVGEITTYSDQDFEQFGFAIALDLVLCV